MILPTKKLRFPIKAVLTGRLFGDKNLTGAADV